MELAQKATHVPYFLKGVHCTHLNVRRTRKAHVPLCLSVSAALTWSSEGSGSPGCPLALVIGIPRCVILCDRSCFTFGKTSLEIQIQI